MNETAAQDMEEDGELTRQRLLRRIAMAGVLIVALVASLAIFDAVFVNPPEPETEVDPAPPVASVSVPPLEERGLEKPEEKTPEAVPEAVPPPVESTEEAKPTPAVSAVPVPEASKPAVKGKPETRPITQPQSKTTAKPAPSVPEATAAPAVPLPPQPPAPKPAQASVAPAPAKPLAPGQGYLVQMGVFSNIANAEDLKSKLDKAGIPAHIEARVQVGPFRNKAEAEAAQKKLAEMGLSGLLLSPRK